MILPPPLAAIEDGHERYHALARDLDELARERAKVSGWNVGRHVEHVTLANLGVVARLEKMAQEPGTARGGASLMGRAILACGFIPRGRAKAPARFEPQGMPGPELVARLEELRQRFGALAPAVPALLESNATSKHPILGQFTARQWLRFVDIHNRHHLKIIERIRAAT